MRAPQITRRVDAALLASSCLVAVLAVAVLAVTVLAVTGCKKRAPSQVTLMGCTVVALVDAPNDAVVELGGKKADYQEAAGVFSVGVPLESLGADATVAEIVIKKGGREERVRLPVVPDAQRPRGVVKNGLCVVASQAHSYGATANSTLVDPSGNASELDLSKPVDIDAPAALEVGVHGETATKVREGYFSLTLNPSTLVRDMPSVILATSVTETELTVDVPLAVKTAVTTRTVTLRVKAPRASSDFRRAAIERLLTVAQGHAFDASPSSGPPATVLVRSRTLTDDAVWLGPPLNIGQVSLVVLETTSERTEGACQFDRGSVPIVLSDSQLVVYDAHTGKIVDRQSFVAKRGPCPSVLVLSEKDRQRVSFSVPASELVDWLAKRH